MDTSKLNGGGDTGKITTLNENVDRVLIVTAEGKQQWMTPGDAATELQKKMATVTVSQARSEERRVGKERVSTCMIR